MSLEDLTGSNKFIDALIPANPENTDVQEQGADHLRGIKNVLSNSFPNITAAVTATAAQIDAAALNPAQPTNGESATAPVTGTSVDFTIPAGAKRCVLMINGLSTTGTADVFIRMNDEASGYTTVGGTMAATSAVTNQTAGFPVANSISAAFIANGTYQFDLEDITNKVWIGTFTGQRGDAAGLLSGAGKKTLTADLTKISITTANTFDAGTAKVRWYF